MNPLKQVTRAVQVVQNKQQGGFNMQGMLQQFENFRGSFKGNANATIRNLVSSGRVSNQQLEQAKSMAQQFGAMLCIK